MQAALAGEFEFGGDSEPPSTCTARREKGIRCSRVSRNWAQFERWRECELELRPSGRSHRGR